MVGFGVNPTEDVLLKWREIWNSNNIRVTVENFNNGCAIDS